MKTLKMIRNDGAEAIVNEEETELWRGYGFVPEGEKPAKAKPESAQPNEEPKPAKRVAKRRAK